MRAKYYYMRDCKQCEEAFRPECKSQRLCTDCIIDRKEKTKSRLRKKKFDPTPYYLRTKTYKNETFK